MERIPLFESLCMSASRPGETGPFPRNCLISRPLGSESPGSTMPDQSDGAVQGEQARRGTNYLRRLD